MPHNFAAVSRDEAFGSREPTGPAVETGGTRALRSGTRGIDGRADAPPVTTGGPLPSGFAAASLRPCRRVARLHLFEFEDQQWCPALLRNAITGYLRLAVAVTQQIRPVVPALAGFLRSTGESSILDLCSGSGGIASQLARGLARRGQQTRIVLSDLYPDTASFGDIADASGGMVEFRSAPLDATAVPAELPGLRTVFNAFHHFRPREARRVLAAAAESGRPIAVIEFIERGIIPLSGILFSPILVLFLAPFLRPFRWQALLFIYVVPIVPLMILWDGLVSWLRVYSLDELRAMAASVAVPGYAGEAGHWRAGPVRVTYLLGRKVGAP